MMKIKFFFDFSNFKQILRMFETFLMPFFLVTSKIFSSILFHKLPDEKKFFLIFFFKKSTCPPLKNHSNHHFVVVFKQKKVYKSGFKHAHFSAIETPGNKKKASKCAFFDFEPGNKNRKKNKLKIPERSKQNLVCHVYMTDAFPDERLRKNFFSIFIQNFLLQFSASFDSDNLQNFVLT